MTTVLRIRGSNGGELLDTTPRDLTQDESDALRVELVEAEDQSTIWDVVEALAKRYPTVLRESDTYAESSIRAADAALCNLSELLSLAERRWFEVIAPPNTLFE